MWNRLIHLVVVNVFFLAADVALLAILQVVEDHLVTLLDQLIVWSRLCGLLLCPSRIPFILKFKVVFSESLAVHGALLKLLFLLACLLHHILEALAVD